MIDVKTIPRDGIPGLIIQLAARLAEPAAISNSPETAGSDLVDARTLAARLGVPESHIRTLQRTGRIPFERVGRKYIRFSVSAVLDALRSSTP